LLLPLWQSQSSQGRGDKQWFRSRAVAHAVIGERNKEDQRLIIMIKQKLGIGFPRENDGVIVNNCREIFDLIGSTQCVA
jgi:hypothetical protein